MDSGAHLAQCADKTWEAANALFAAANQQQQLLSRLALHHVEKIRAANWSNLATPRQAMAAFLPAMAQPSVFQAGAEYLCDLAQRWVRFVDTLRQRGNSYIAREAEGALFEQLQLVLGNKATDWREPEYDVKPSQSENVTTPPHTDAAE